MSRRLVRRWSSRSKATSARETSASTAQSRTMRVSSPSSTPGTLRVVKGYGADKHEAELDSTLARIIGSDWGDRSRQPVSLPMRMYWTIFLVVLGNGLYTYFTGKDESFLVEKLKKMADAKWGVPNDENEFTAMGEDSVTDHISDVLSSVLEEKKMAGRAQPTRLNSSLGSSPGMPFILVPGSSLPTNARQLTSKNELEQQLVQLQVQQERLQNQICSGEGAAKDELEHQVRMLDIQKEQVQVQIKRL